ncbi:MULTISPECIES: DUF6082 family protein [unclassified Streptomyces]|uniref:DUF6082 family protein n=1 Tax=unclassified Streptomyces TaxID=2593676 RepID=UPI001661C06C|nr:MULTISPECIES: DUF6082 family protein [unclassified Streptomyces]MBD0838164.1 hypothetical protein [Streptomyces sp. TRM68416]
MVTQKFGTRGCSSALLAGLVTAAVGVLIAQQRRLQQLRRSQLSEQQRHTNLAHQQRLQWELLSKAMEDPALAAVLDTHDGALSPDKHRQYLFANAVYTNALLAYRIGNVSRAELFGHLRGTVQNPIFREYWEASRAARASLEVHSVEAQVGRMLDGLIRELDEADTEEWWVVGEPPE